MHDFQQRYQQICQHVRQTQRLASAAEVLSWDEHTYMPPEAGPYRAEQLQLLAGVVHQRRTDPDWGARLEELAAWAEEHRPGEPETVNLLRLRRDWRRQKRLPQSLVEQLAHATSRAQQVWAESRPQNDWNAFRPWLEKVLELKRQQAEALGYQEHIYDALLEDYEPGATTAQVREVLEPLGEALRQLVQRIADSPVKTNPRLLHRHWPRSEQEKLGCFVAEQLGFSFRRGRLDVTAHPFCTRLGPHDVRITTRYDEQFFPSAFFSILHEAGHGLYEQGLPAQEYGLPLGDSVSLGVHESQSRLWENHVGRSLEFWRWCFPKARGHFPEALADVSLEEFHRAVNHVEPSLIRVEADEVTYNLHILVRFELEQELLTGQLAVADLPEAWNARYEHYLGVQVPDVARGVMQDVHWSAGLVGYFPTYSLGNLYAAQLMEAAARDVGPLEEQWSRGEFAPLLEWMRQHVHHHGRRYDPAELIGRATGSPPRAEPLLGYLHGRFGAIYQL